jgi:hypothetical protein
MVDHARTYARGAKPPPDLAFQAEALPRVTQPKLIRQNFYDLIH